MSFLSLESLIFHQFPHLWKVCLIHVQLMNDLEELVCTLKVIISYILHVSEKELQASFPENFPKISLFFIVWCLDTASFNNFNF